MSTVPNIVTGRVTNRTNSQRRTPNWLKVTYAFLLAVVAIVGLSLIFGPKGDALPACKFEDGSGQSVCYWDADTQGNGKGHDVINVNGKSFVRK